MLHQDIVAYVLLKVGKISLAVEHLVGLARCAMHVLGYIINQGWRREGIVVLGRLKVEAGLLYGYGGVESLSASHLTPAAKSITRYPRTPLSHRKCLIELSICAVQKRGRGFDSLFFLFIVGIVSQLIGSAAQPISNVRGRLPFQRRRDSAR